jgi:GT2 family glycosyltransferase
MPCDVIVVTFNSECDIAGCIASILANGANPLVIDNGSQDKTLQILAKNFPQVPLLHNPSNGYARAANLGFANTNCDLAIVSNADVIFPADAIVRLASCMVADPRIAVLGAQQVYPDGSWQRSWGPVLGLSEALIEAFGLTTMCNALRKVLWPIRIDRRLLDVGYVDGAVMMVRRSAFEAVEGFDETFPFSAEDTDFCFRARTAGWQVMALPTVDVIHRRGGSRSRSGWSLDHEVSVLLDGVRRFLYKHHSQTYQTCYLMVKKLFNRYMSLLCRAMSQLSSGAIRLTLADKARIHRCYAQQLSRVEATSRTVLPT